MSKTTFVGKLQKLKCEKSEIPDRLTCFLTVKNKERIEEIEFFYISKRLFNSLKVGDTVKLTGTDDYTFAGDPFGLMGHRPEEKIWYTEWGKIEKINNLR